MENNKVLNVAITISIKRATIRISNKSLELLDKPAFVLLLFNSVKNLLSLTKGESYDVQAHNISKYYSSNNGARLYSKYLTEKLKLIIENCDPHRSYKFYGEYNPNTKTVQFNIKNAILVSKNEK